MAEAAAALLCRRRSAEAADRVAVFTGPELCGTVGQHRWSQQQSDARAYESLVASLPPAPAAGATSA